MAKFRTSFEEIVNRTGRWATDFNTHERYVDYDGVTFHEGGRIFVPGGFDNKPDRRADVKRICGLRTGLLNELPELILPSGETLPKAWLTANFCFAADVEHNRVYRMDSWASNLYYPHKDAAPIHNQGHSTLGNRFCFVRPPTQKALNEVIRSLQEKRTVAKAVYAMSKESSYPMRISITPDGLHEDWSDELQWQFGRMSDEDFRAKVKEILSTEETTDFLLVDRRFTY